MSNVYNPRADLARFTFRVGNYRGRVFEEPGPNVSPAEIRLHARLTAPERDKPEEMILIHQIETIPMPRSAEELSARVRLMFDGLWRHEFDEGFMVDGVRVRDPHANEDAA